MADKNTKKKTIKKVVTKELSLGERQRQYALTVLIRKKEAFASVYKQISPEMFARDGAKGYGIVWAAVRSHFDKFGELPEEEVLLADVEQRLSLAEDIDEDSIEALDEFLESAFSRPVEQLTTSVAMSLVSKMLIEHAQYSLLADIQGGGVVSDLGGLLADHAKLVDAASSVTAGRAPLPFPDKPEEVKALVLEPTGVSFLDMYMNGGMARREVNGFCGPFGSCKTTLGVKLAVERARHSLRVWRDGGCQGLPERVYFISWEEDKDMLGPRFLAYAGHISIRSLQGKDFQKNLSRGPEAHALKVYERDFYRDQIAAGVVQGEYERMTHAMAELNQCLRIIDFSGADPTYRQAAGQMVDGVVSVITRDQQLDGNPGVGLVVIDYAGAAAERAIMSGNSTRDELRHLIGKMPLNLKNMVAAPFDCQVWCLHQLGTEANSRNAGIAPKSTDAAEARNFFENVNFGFMVGKPNKDNLTVLTNGKQRRAARKEDIVVHIQGEFSDVVDVSKRFMISDSTIVSRADAHQVVRNIIRDDGSAERANRRNDNDIGV